MAILDGLTGSDSESGWEGTVRVQAKALPGRKVAWSIWALSLLLVGTALILLSLARFRPIGGGPVSGLAGGPTELLFLIEDIVLVTFGALVASRRPRNPIGWIMLAIGGGQALGEVQLGYVSYSRFSNLSLPGTALAAWLAIWMWLPVVSGVGLLLLLFPTGRLPSRRWRPVVWFGILASIALVAGSFGASPLAGSSQNVQLQNPFAVESMSAPFKALLRLGFALAAAALVATIASIVVRYRRSAGDERQQLKWFVFAALLFGLAVAVGLPLTSLVPDINSQALDVIYALVFAAVPAAAAIAILKYRLYDIDVLINKTVVYGALAAFVTAVYVAVVVGIGRLAGSAERPNLGLSLAASVLVAVAFQPVRERAQRFANKLVYGERLSPYEVISDLSRRLSAVLSHDTVLPGIAEAAARGVRAARVRVKLRLPGGGEETAFWPPDATDGPFERRIPVSHHGEAVGEIEIAMPPGRSIDPPEAKLLDDLASQAGLALRNLRLTGELQVKLEELQASRRRIVQAQDSERRRIERNIHDGVQAEMVGMMAKLRLARNQLSRAPADAESTLEELQREIRRTLEDIRELAHGIHPPVLADQGLVRAIEARASRLPIGVAVEAGPELWTARYPGEIEGTAYFVASEALANVLKHASAHQARVLLDCSDGCLTIEVADDGRGLAPEIRWGSGLSGLKDRVEALGGTIAVVSAAEWGTRVIARLPVARDDGLLHAFEDAGSEEPVGAQDG